MIQRLVPAVWLIVLIVGLPQLSETVYTPSLPDISNTLKASETLVEYTLTIYLFAFAIGTLFWGKLSDKFGRKPCVLGGLFIFILGCIGCYFSESITALMISRFIQAFGGSIGSVLGQAICRDSFHGQALGKAYSSIGSALAVFPALGPVMGGFISEHYGWPGIFLFLSAFGLILSLLVTFRLPETHQLNNRQSIPFKEVGLRLIKNRHVWGLGIIVGAANGINFSYFAEGPFYLIQLLGLTPSQYGLSFIAIAGSSMVGAIISRKLHDHRSSKTIMGYGLFIILTGSFFFSLLILGSTIIQIPKTGLILITLLSQMSIMLGIGMTTGNALALALIDYKDCIGTASSLFGFFYYSLISLFTLGMGALHNDTLLPMPFYFLALSLLMILCRKIMPSN